MPGKPDTKRRIAIITTSRADYGIYRHVARELARRPGMDVGFLVSGTHLASKGHGRTVSEIEADGLAIFERIDIDMVSDKPAALTRSMSLATAGFGKAFERHAPNIILTLGDRFEMLAAVSAALPFRLPIAHLHGGELSLGAIDEVIRHAISKISHLHFVATEAYGRRIGQMGEENWRITVSGAPALDTLRHTDLPDRAELEAFAGLSFGHAPLLVTIHPETLSDLPPRRQAEMVLAALRNETRPIVITAPNADVGGAAIAAEIHKFIAARPNVALVESFGIRNYFGMMRIAGAMIGNSSSGIIEAASFTLPVVNIGQRQAGRLRAPNVVDCDWTLVSIGTALSKALDPGFRSSLPQGINPYGDGHAAERIADVLTAVAIDRRLLAKSFVDLECRPATGAPVVTA